MYRILDYDLYRQGEGLPSLREAIRVCLKWTDNETRPVFIENSGGDIVRLVHCGVVYKPTNEGETIERG